MKRIGITLIPFALFTLTVSMAYGSGYQVTTDLWIRAVINTVEKGPIDAVWKLGGEDTTSAGDTVIWGFFYASPSDVTWGSQNNPDLYVKIWFDHGGRVDVNFFHVSVPDMDVYSQYSPNGSSSQNSKTTTNNRYFRHEYNTDSSTPGAFSQSFSPIKVTDTNGNPAVPYWIYNVMGGNALSFYEDGVYFTMLCSDVRIEINASGTTKTADFSAQISGDATGSVDVSVIENLTADATTTLIQRVGVTMDMDLSAQGESLDLLFDMNILFSPEAEWFLDRNDLDTLPVGYVYNERGLVTATASGYVEITGYGREYFNDPLGTSAEFWEIVGKNETVTTGGVTYQDAIKVKRNTVLPSMNSTSGTEPVELIYWVVKGIGMVKGIGQYSILGRPLTIELIETNLTQSF